MNTVMNLVIWAYMLGAPLAVLALYTQVVAETTARPLEVALAESRVTAENLLVVLEGRDCTLLETWGPYAMKIGIGSMLTPERVVECVGPSWSTLIQDTPPNGWEYAMGGE